MLSARVPPVVETIELRGTVIHYTVRRHPRAKYMRITITPHNGVVVTLPARLRRYVSPAKLLEEKQDWVLEQIARIPLPEATTPLADGARIYYLGEEIVVSLRDGGLWQGCELRGNELIVRVPLDYDGEPRALVLAWIRERAADVIAREAREQAERIGVAFNRLAVRDQKTKWGSCSKNGNLSFNWRLILFPPAILRYVVIHELCHLRHFNHSARFWNLVARHDPQFQTSIDWLRENGPRMEGALR